MSAGFGQQVIVENRPRAGTTIGADAVAKSAPDGHTLLITENSFSLRSPALYPKLAYDPVKDFVHVMIVAEAPYILWSRTDLHAKTMKELVEAARVSRALSRSLLQARAPRRTSADSLFRRPTSRRCHVPFKGVGASMTEATAECASIFRRGSSIASPIAHISAGRLRPLAVTGGERSPTPPDSTVDVRRGGLPRATTRRSGSVTWLRVGTPPRSWPGSSGSELAKAVAKPAFSALRQAGRENPDGRRRRLSPAALPRRGSTWRDLVARRGIKVE